MIEIFTLAEKRTFIETLLVIAGILTGFSPNATKTIIFVLFAIASLGYIIFISILKHKTKNIKITNNQEAIYFMLSFWVGFLFSLLILSIDLGNQTFLGLPQMISNGIVILTLFILGGFLTFVLVTDRENFNN